MTQAETRGTVTSMARVLELLARGQERALRGLNLTPPENVLSPLARVPFVLDVYGRYFFDHMTKFGSWSFLGALDAGEIEQDILLPQLRAATGAEFVDVHPLSGLHCMTIAIAALCAPGDLMLTVPVAGGGHICTTSVARRLGAEVDELPMESPYDIDIELLEGVLRERRPMVIYIDQSSQLFPIDPRPLRDAVDRCSPETTIHFDGSHLNGLILGGAMFNPLERGAHSLGGSTHKTLPGPHKGFLATSDPGLATRFAEAVDSFVSHHHPAEVVSLAITMVELRDCGGADYARRTIDNARTCAAALHARGAAVVAADRGFTDCHQMWVDLPGHTDAAEVTDRLARCGVVVNKLDGLPGLSGTAFRLSLAEFTRLGGREADARALAGIVADVVLDGADHDAVGDRVGALRGRLDRPRYCYSAADLGALGAPPQLVDLCAAIESANAAP